jgi:uncharacterized protein (DUF3084 family)
MIQKLQKAFKDRDNQISVQKITINEKNNAIKMLGHKISELETTKHELIVWLAVVGGIYL